uniref:Uncharacterized protein n=1 Tax=Arundo donax TaxID=35708 RepID=A0A0A9FVJ8_ARUDO
MIRLYQITII